MESFSPLHFAIWVAMLGAGLILSRIWAWWSGSREVPDPLMGSELGEVEARLLRTAASESARDEHPPREPEALLGWVAEHLAALEPERVEIAFRWIGARRLEALGEPAVERVGELLGALAASDPATWDDREWRLAISGLRAVSLLKHRGVEPTLLRALELENPALQEAALQLLSEVGGLRAVEPLARFSERAEVGGRLLTPAREALTTVITRLEETRGEEGLFDLLEVDRPLVLEAAFARLKAIGGPRALELLWPFEQGIFVDGALRDAARRAADAIRARQPPPREAVGAGAPAPLPRRDEGAATGEQ
jgi:hypothetical protein